MSSILSNILICCHKGEEKYEIIENNLNEEKNYKKIKSKTSNSNKTNSNSKNTIMDSNKKYSFIISNSSLINNQEKNTKNEKENKSENISENQKIIFSNDRNNEINNSNIFLSENENSLINTFKKDNKKEQTIISNIIFDNSFTSENSSSLKNITHILNETKSNKSSKQILRETKPLLFNSSFQKEKKKKKNEINLDFDNVILDEEIELAPKLTLTDYKNSNLFNGKIIKIDASGYKNSLRGKKDGKTYFGIKNNFDKKENDIIINIYDKKIKNNPLFVIFYDKNKTRYFIQYLNNDFNNNKLYMTIRIYNELFINKDEIRLLYLILGKILITLSIGENDDLCFKIYKNSISNNIENRRILEYNFKISDSPITIGREKCSIILENNFISRVHTTFIYGNNNKWCLFDGNEKRRHSTHGTWIILNNNFFELNPLNENYEVKIGEYAFNISIQTE